MLDADRPVLNGELGLPAKRNGTYLSFSDRGFVSCAMQFHPVGWNSVKRCSNRNIASPSPV